MYTYTKFHTGIIEPGHSVVMVHHLDEGSISIVEAAPDDLACLGANNIDSYPIHTPIEVTDSDGDRHLIIVLSKC